MNIFVFSDRNMKRIFQQLGKSKQYSVLFVEIKKMKKYLREEKDECFYYLDTEGLTKNQITSLLRSDKNKNIHFGLIDQKQSITDPAILFKIGLCDYLGPKLCRESLSVRRFELISSIGDGGIKKKLTEKGNDLKISSIKIKEAKDWENIQSGNEYLFNMMFIELDGSRNIGYRVREATVNRLLKNFQKTVEVFTSVQKGRLWIWSDFGGIVLFPFSINTTDIVTTCMRLMFSRRIISVDQSEQKLLLSYRIVLYTGSTIYRERGKTGHIISDAVNSLAHIGQKYAQPGNMYIVKNMFQRCKPEIKNCFSESGKFEGAELFRMRLPQPY